ncbi:MAG: DUF4367 domain-containing protein [Clostridia bacterium]|nr:DUF4367 domain-containing protein [Clostridia bacterium]
MKNEKWIDVIGGIDPNLVENAEKASGNDAVSSRKARKFTGFKRVAVIAVAVILTVGGLLMLNANVRAAVLGMFVYQDEAGYQRVHYEGSEAEVDIHSVSIGYIPEGFAAREMTEDDLGEGYDSRIHQIRIVKEEDVGLSAYELANNYWPEIVININRAGEIDWGYDRDAFEMAYESTLNGMDAIILHNDSEIESTNIQFSDDKITVNVWGIGMTMDEAVSVAESISW